MNYPTLGHKVQTPDGPGIAKSIELRGPQEKTVVVCALERPYKADPWTGRRDYDFPPYSFGYAYDLTEIQNV